MKAQIRPAYATWKEKCAAMDLAVARSREGLDGQFRCATCGEVKDLSSRGGVGTGYGTLFTAKMKNAAVNCYDCCANIERQFIATNDRWTGYIDFVGSHVGTNVALRNTYNYSYHMADPGTFYVTDWTGKLRIPCHATSIGRHNMHGILVRFVWFRDHMGRLWMGRHIGQHTQLVHCRRLKYRGKVAA